MNLEARLLSGGLILAAAVTAAGCATDGGIAATSLQNRADTPFTEFDLAPPGGAEIDQVLARVPPNRRDAARRPEGRNALIGLYGEWMNRSTDAASGQFDGGNSLIQVSAITEGACFDPDVNRAGTLLAFASTMHRPTSDIYLKPTNGKTITQLTTDPADDMMPSFSPDGTKIAFASNRSGHWDVYVASVNGGPPVQVTNNPDPELHPSWSPDGRMLAYCRFGSQSGRWELWLINLANPGVQHFLDYGLFPEWCPDVARSKILYQRARQRGSRLHSIWTIDFVNGEAIHPTEIVSAAHAAAINPKWAPDGTRIVFVTVLEPGDDDLAPEQSDVWIVNLNGDGRTNLTSGRFANFQPTWGGNGYVYFISSRTGVDNIWAVPTARAIDLGQLAPAGTPTVRAGRPDDDGQP